MVTNFLNTNGNSVYKTVASELNNIIRFGTRIENFKQSLFPSYVNEWYKLDISLDISLPKILNVLIYVKEFLSFGVGIIIIICYS